MIEIKLQVTAEMMKAIADLLTNGVPEESVTEIKGSDFLSPATEKTIDTTHTTGVDQTIAPVVEAGTVAQAAFGAPSQPAPATSEPIVSPAPVVFDTEVDNRGLPWDGRINNKMKTKDKDGNWKYTRGIDRQTLVPQVEAELRAAMASQSQEELAADPTPATPPAVQQQETQAPTADAGNAHGVTFADILPKIIELQTNGDITEDNINFVCGKFGVPNLTAFALPEHAGSIPQLAMLLGVAL